MKFTGKYAAFRTRAHKVLSESREPLDVHTIISRMGKQISCLGTKYHNVPKVSQLSSLMGKSPHFKNCGTTQIVVGVNGGYPITRWTTQ